MLDSRVVARRANNRFYREALAKVRGIGFMPEAALYGRANVEFERPAKRRPARMTEVLSTAGGPACRSTRRPSAPTARSIRLKLESLDIEARSVWKPIVNAVFSGCRARGGKVSEELFERGLCLPSGSGLTPEDRARVVDGLLSARG